MATPHHYVVNIKWLKEREGLLSSPTLQQSIEVVTPPEFPKGVAGVWSPEHLFVASINSCLMTTFLAIAENSKLEYTSFNSKATGKLELIDGKYLISEVMLEPKINIINESEKDKALRVLYKSEAACLISNSIKSKILFNPMVQLQNQ